LIRALNQARRGWIDAGFIDGFGGYHPQLFILGFESALGILQAEIRYGGGFAADKFEMVCLLDFARHENACRLNG
jgi:hypothetical protein